MTPQGMTEDFIEEMNHWTEAQRWTAATCIMGVLLETVQPDKRETMLRGVVALIMCEQGINALN